jgi:hypothetical protein
MEPRQIVETVIDVLIGTYGNLGYLDFKVHSIEPNGRENVFIVKYSFIPRDNERKRLFYETRIDVRDKNNFATKEIKESEL